MGLGLLAAAKAANQMPDALQEGVETLAGFGLDPRKAVAMMKPIGRAATAYKAEIKDLSSAAFAANDNLKVPIEQTGRVIDIMAQAGKSGAFEIKDMAQYFPTLTAAAQGLGQKGAPAVADLAAALQIARKGTGDSASAATNVANLLQKMNSPDAIKKFEKFGVDLPAALERAYKAGKTPIEAIAELTNKTLGGDLSRLGFLFEDAQVQQALRPLIQNIDEYKRIRADAFGAKGVTDADFAERLQDGAEKAKAFSVQAKVLGLTMGAALLPTATALLTKLTGFATWLGDLATRYPQAAKWAGLLAGGFAALMIVLGAVGIAAAGVMAPFAALGFAATLAGTTQAVLWAKFGRALMFPLRIFPLLGRGIAWVGGLALRILPMIGRAAMMMATGVARAGLFLLANPMILAIVALVAIVAGAAYLIWKHWDTIKAAFFGAVAWMGEAWSAIRARFAAGVAAIGGFFGSLWQGLRSGVGNILAFLGALPLRFAEFGRNMIMGMISGITGMLGALKSTIVNAASSAANWFKQKLGIHSPSRVFMAFGGHIADGLAIGIQRGASEPIKRVHRLSRDVAAAMVIGVAAPAVASAGIAGGASKGGAGGAFGGGGDRYEIHLHAAPGMSEDQLIAKLEQKLREIAAGKAARARKSYADEQDG
jgi:TP901 family phage tail tape measure protein